MEGIPGVCGRHSSSASCLGEQPLFTNIDCWTGVAGSISLQAAVTLQVLQRSPVLTNVRAFQGRAGSTGEEGLGGERKAIRVITAPGLRSVPAATSLLCPRSHGAAKSCLGRSRHSSKEHRARKAPVPGQRADSRHDSLPFAGR